MDDEDRSDTIAELIAEARAEKRRRDRYLAHPDPRDPNWPGHNCDEDQEDNDGG